MLGTTPQKKACLYDLGQPLDALGFGCGIIIKGLDMDSGSTYSVDSGARIAQSAYKRGKAYDIGWGDADFEGAGSGGGFSNSVFWYNQGTSLMETSTAQKYAGEFSARGGSGTSQLIQDVDLENTTGIPSSDLDSSACYLTARVFRWDDGTTGQARVQFLDKDGTELGYGQ